MGKVTIAFLGATETVTGSRFLVTSDKSKILVDAGMFQGLKEDRRKNWDPFPVEPSTISAIVLTMPTWIIQDICRYWYAMVLIERLLRPITRQNLLR